MTREKKIQLPILDVALFGDGGVGDFKMFFFKLEDLAMSSKNLAVLAWACNPSTGKMETEAFGAMLVSQPEITLGMFLVTERPGLTKQGGLLLRNNS